jgi:hypothetical protein
VKMLFTCDSTVFGLSTSYTEARAAYRAGPELAAQG